MAAYHNLLSTQSCPSIEGQVSTGQTIVWNGTAWVAGNLTTVQKGHYNLKSVAGSAHNGNGPFYFQQSGATSTGASAGRISFPTTIRITKLSFGWEASSISGATTLTIGYNKTSSTPATGNTALATFSTSGLSAGVSNLMAEGLDVTVLDTEYLTLYYSFDAGTTTLTRPWITIEYEF